MSDPHGTDSSTGFPTDGEDRTADAGAPSPSTPQPAEAEVTGIPATPDEGAAEEDDEADDPVGADAAEEQPGPSDAGGDPDVAVDARSGGAVDGPEPDADPDDDPPRSRFAAPFSSPEPTAVVARPRRRATRPALSADPDSVEAPPLLPAAPAAAFVSFVAPSADVPAPPRRRSRRPTESPDAPEDVTSDGARSDPDGDADHDPNNDPNNDPDNVPGNDLDDNEAPRSRRSRSRSRRAAAGRVAEEETEAADDAADDSGARDEDDDRDEETSASRRRRRGRRGRGRGRSGEDSTDTDGENEAGDEDEEGDGSADTGGRTDDDAADASEDDTDEPDGSTRRRRRRRRRGGSSATDRSDDRADEVDDDDRPERAGRNGRTTSDDDVRGVAGSTRLEAKRQRRRDGRDTGRRRTPILTEAEFLARRESVDRTMVIRQRGERTQIAVLEDGVLVEHYVTQASATSFAGNVYLGRVQNVLPSMEAAFVDIGKGRNAVLYAGEVNWDAAGLSGKQRSIETALKSGDKVLVQVTKDPIGHKGARLTQQINLPGRFLVFVPGGSMTGISRKLPDTERQRLKDVLKKIVPEDVGVIIRTAAEGASEEELTRDVNRLTAQWEVIQKKAETTTSAPALLYGEPDLAIRVIRDVFNEDFKELIVQGEDAWDTVEAYVAHVSPELSGRLSRFTGEGDVFHDLRIDEQLTKALDRKVWLPSGGSLVIDRTEAMTVVDVNTGKFTGSGGNLEQTVTRNNMEAAEEIVRQLRLRDIGGMIVIDFIDMVLESNRDLVLRRLTECLGRDRTKHQVAEVTSLGLVQMTRKRVGQGLLEVFSEPCDHCRGRGLVVHTDPVDEKRRGGGSSGGPASGGSGGAAGGSGGPRRSGAKDPVKEPAKDTTKDPVKDTAEDTAPAAEAVEEPGSGTDAGPADPGVDEGGRGRRSRGRRNRGQSGADRAAEDAAVLAESRDGSGDEPTGGTGTAEAPPVEPTAAADAVPDADAVPVEDAPEVALVSTSDPAVEETASEVEPERIEPERTEPAVTLVDTATSIDTHAAAGAAGDGAGVVGRPRRRRAASRPAGPPA